MAQTKHLKRVWLDQFTCNCLELYFTTKW